MTEQKLIHTIDILLTIASVIALQSFVFIVCLLPPDKEKTSIRLIPLFEPIVLESVDISHDVEALIPPVIKEKPVMKEPNDVLLRIDQLEFTFQRMEFEYVGRHFITAYCPEECGWSWSTSSGATCHWSSDWKTPTTCAIDLGYHKYGEVILIGNPKDPNNRKVYITEDTGPGVKGLWVDCFVETMDEVRRWNTRYDSVWNVTYVPYTISVGDVRHRQEITRMEELYGKYWYKEVENNA